MGEDGGGGGDGGVGALRRSAPQAVLIKVYV